MKYIRTFFIFFVSVIVILLAGEIYIRSASIQDRSNNKLDESLGRIRRENFQYTKLNEGFSVGQFNEFSYMGKGYPKGKSDSVIRIALIGDSYVEGFQVCERDHFRTILEDNLAKNVDSDVQVLNFGRSGLGLENIYALDSLFVREFFPDYVLYFVGESDFYNQASDPLIPRVKLVEADLVIDNDYSQSAIREFQLTNPLLQKSSFLSMLNNSRKIIFSDLVYRKLFDKLIPEIKSGCETKQGIPKIPEINQKIIEAIALDPKIILINRSDDIFNEEITKLLNENNITPIDLSIPLQELHSQGIDPHYWKATNKRGHWNHKTHKVIGEYISNQITIIINAKVER